jgi:hypothetical protein
MVVALVGGVLNVAMILSCEARQLVFSSPHLHPRLMISTCLRKADGERLRTTDWQGRGYLQTAMLLEDRVELVQGWMTSQNRFLAGEERAEACCAMRMRGVQKGARGGLRNDNQLRWQLHGEQLDTHQEEDTVVGCQRRRPGSAVATNHKAATSGLDHSRAVAVERMDEGEMGAARAMGVS